MRFKIYSIFVLLVFLVAGFANAAKWYVDCTDTSGGLDSVWAPALIASGSSGSHALGPWNLSSLPASPSSVKLYVTVNGILDSAFFCVDSFANPAAVTSNEIRRILNFNDGSNDYGIYYPGYLDSCYCLDSCQSNKIFLYTRKFGKTATIKIRASWIADSLGLDTLVTHT
jgi:hypothetical protein